MPTPNEMQSMHPCSWASSQNVTCVDPHILIFCQRISAPIKYIDSKRNLPGIRTWYFEAAPVAKKQKLGVPNFLQLATTDIFESPSQDKLLRSVANIIKEYYNTNLSPLPWQPHSFYASDSWVRVKQRILSPFPWTPFPLNFR